MSGEDQKKELFLNQKQLLDTFLEHGAISRAQYDKSLGDLIEKMGIRDNPIHDEEAKMGDVAAQRGYANRSSSSVYRIPYIPG